MTDRRPALRLDATVVVAAVVVALTVVVSLLVRTDDVRVVVGAGPTESPLERSDVVCPAAGTDLRVATTGTAGEVEVRAGRSRSRADVVPGTGTTVDVGERAAVVTGEGEVAPGLVAARFSTPLAAWACGAPAFEQWFTGAGAGARHTSALQLVNPDEGRAVVDVVVLGADGVVDVPALRELAVRGGETRTIELARLLPRRDLLTLGVTVVRGRVAASMVDSYQGIGSGGREGTDALASQPAPAERNLLLGVTGGRGPRQLVLANPGESQGRATLSLVTSDATFTPGGLEPVDLPPGSTVRVPLTAVLREAAAGDEDPVALVVDSTVPTTATLGMFVRGDLVNATPVAPVESQGATPLPKGEKLLVLGGATRPGVAEVATWDADGEPLATERVEVGPDSAASLELPGRARLVVVRPARTPVEAVVRVTGKGAATLVRVVEPVSTGLVPDVRPAPVG
ncbi:hypothetical protein GCM10023340_31180 [Nocardioides marinquilinus]|uniref:Uncharacterized protein n=1 Tax=Nocardioides marinquilinus TaxID=1210400 RepID=A0ABP9PTI0_9ACTN